MKAEELRIGNLITHKGKQFKVGYIGFSGVGADGLDADHDEIEPISLSREWLIRFGFEKINHIHGYEFWHHKKYKVDWYDRKTLYMGYIVNHCDSIHKLQNLIYALTGEELTLKP